MPPHNSLQTLSSRPSHRGVKRDGSSTAFFVSDSSPSISYASTSGTSPWIAGYALVTNGYDETLHLTTTSNSTVSFNVTSTSLTLMVPTFSSCAATITFNSSDPIPACGSNTTGVEIPYSNTSLPYGTHSVTWSSGPIQSSEQVIFWGYGGTRPLSLDTNVTIDDTFTDSDIVGVSYEGDWTYLGSGNEIQTSWSEAGDLSSYYNKTLAITETSGSSVTISASYSAIYLYGNVGPDYGLAQVSLNNEIVAASMNLSSPWSMSNELLWFQTGLDDSQVTDITLTNLEDKKMALDLIILSAGGKLVSALTVDNDTTKFASTLTGKLILFLVLPVAIILFISASAFYISRRRRADSLIHRPTSRYSDASIRVLPVKCEKKQRGWKWGKGSKRARNGRSSSTHSLDAYFSYDEGKNQRLSSRWYSTPTTPMSSGIARNPFPPIVLGNLPVEINHPGGFSPAIETVRERGERTVSVVVGQYDSATQVRDARRGTALPAYSTEGAYLEHYTTSEHGKVVLKSGESWTSGSPNSSSPASRYLTVEEEKAAQLQVFRNISLSSTQSDYSTFSSRSSSKSFSHALSHSHSQAKLRPFTTTPTPPPPSPPTMEQEGEGGSETPDRTSTITASDIMSVFGTAPGSERRMSAMTDHTSIGNGAWYSRPGSSEIPPLPPLSNYPGWNLELTIPKTAAGAGPKIGRPKIDTEIGAHNPYDLPHMSTQASSLGSLGPFGSFGLTQTPGSGGKSALMSKRLSTLGSTLGAGLGFSLKGPPSPIAPSPGDPSSPPSAYTKRSSNGAATATGPAWHKRTQSNFSHITERSAARPDSDVMPYENFITGLNAAREREDMEREIKDLMDRKKAKRESEKA